MRKLFIGLLGIVSLFLATSVYATGTATVRFHQIEVGTLNLGTPTATTIAKVPVMTDNVGSKFDSGALTITSGSVTVTTSLTACDRAFVSIAGSNGSETFRISVSGADFTVTGYDTSTGNTSTTNRTGHWFAIDE